MVSGPLVNSRLGTRAAQHRLPQAAKMRRASEDHAPSSAYPIRRDACPTMTDNLLPLQISTSVPHTSPSTSASAHDYHPPRAAWLGAALQCVALGVHWMNVTRPESSLTGVH